jgi:hypothetical protein
MSSYTIKLTNAIRRIASANIELKRIENDDSDLWFIVTDDTPSYKLMEVVADDVYLHYSSNGETAIIVPFSDEEASDAV